MTDLRPAPAASPLVTGEWLAAHLDDPTVKVIQLLFEPDVDDYSDGHVPGAIVSDWRTLLWHDSDRQFPTPAELGRRLGALGVQATDTIVFYSGRNQYAMYGYWVAHVLCGHERVVVLDGSKKRWTLDGRSLSTGVPTITPVEYGSPAAAARDDRTRIGREAVLAGLGSPGRVLVDGRSPEEYAGLRLKPAPSFDHGAERYGHIPGARNLHARDLMDPSDFTLKPAAELEAMFRAVGAAPDQADEVVVYCRLSHRASGLWFAATQVLGWDHVRIYDGSWTEWGSLVGVPVENPAAG